MFLCLKASGDHTEPNNDEHMAHMCHETAGQEFTSPTDQRIQDGGEMHAVQEQDDTADVTVMSTVFMPQPNRTDLKSCKSCSEAQMSTTVSQATLLVHQDSIRIDERIAECTLNKGSKGVAIAESTNSTKQSETDTIDGTERLTSFIYETGQQWNAIFQDKSTPVRDMSHGESFRMEKNVTQNKNSVLVINSFTENVQGFDNRKGETISSVGTKDYSMETKKENGIEKMKEKHGKNTKKTMGNETEHTVDNKGESTNFIFEQVQGISQFKKQPEIGGVETHLGVVEKTKTYIKVQPERLGESRDQSVVSPIIILPDTRETVIKNVAKMRAVPFTPEIKVTVPEKVKHEEPSLVPKLDVLLSEPERVIHPFVHEVSLMQKDNEPASEAPRGIDSRDPNKNTTDDRVMIIAEPLDVSPPQHEMNFDWFKLDQRIIEDNTQNLEGQIGVKDEPCSASSGWSTGNDSNSIPIISIACADDIAPFQEQEKEYGNAVFHDTVHLDSAALKIQVYSTSLIPKTQVESSTENIIRKEVVPESLTVIHKEVMGQFDSGEASHNTNQIVKKDSLLEEGTDRSSLVETEISSDISSTSTLSKTLKKNTACDTDVCPDKESKVEPDADRFQRDKPAMEKLSLMTPVGPTLPPLSPASLRRLMAKNNPILESQSSTVTILGDGSEKKGEDSGGSTPTSTLSCESSPKMKRRDSLTLIPSATPEELASGARRKIYLAKTKSEDEGSETQSKRDSPYMSPSQARRAAFLQLQSGQQTQHMEKRSPLLSRRKTMVELHKPKEDPLEETNMSNMENKPAEKEKLDPYKGNTSDHNCILLTVRIQFFC